MNSRDGDEWRALAEARGSGISQLRARIAELEANVEWVKSLNKALDESNVSVITERNHLAHEVRLRVEENKHLLRALTATADDYEKLHALVKGGIHEAL